MPLTARGVAEIVGVLFAEAEAAIFDHDAVWGVRGRGLQVTEWAPYDVRVNPGLECPVNVDHPWIELRTPDGTWIRWPTPGPVLAGTRLYPPPLHQWIATTDDV